MDFRFKNLETNNILTETFKSDEYKYKDLNIKDKNSFLMLPNNDFEILGLHFELNKKF